MLNADDVIAARRQICGDESIIGVLPTVPMANDRRSVPVAASDLAAMAQIANQFDQSPLIMVVVIRSRYCWTSCWRPPLGKIVCVRSKS